MDQSQFRNLLKRYKDGHANAQERAFVDAWYEQLKSDTQPLTETEQPLVRDAIRRGIEKQVGPSNKPVKRLPNRYTLAAATLLVFLGFGLLIWKNRSNQVPANRLIEYVEVSADPGKLKHIVLPDSSIVWLNSGSKLRFPMPFDVDSTRRVFLEYGEAFFDIAPNARRPFIVHADGLDTRVLGTSFTVRAYASLPDIQVSVLSGHVEVSRSDHPFQEALKPGDQFSYNKQDSTHTVQQTETQRSNTWVTGTTYLSQASFAELATVFQNAYNIQLKAGHAHILKQKYSIQLDRETPIEDIVEAICALYQDTYKKEENTITIY